MSRIFSTNLYGRGDIAGLYNSTGGVLIMTTWATKADGTLKAANASGGFAGPVKAWDSATFGAYTDISFSEESN